MEAKPDDATMSAMNLSLSLPTMSGLSRRRVDDFSSSSRRTPPNQHLQLSEQGLPQAKEFIQPCQRFRGSALGLKIYHHRCQRMYFLVYLFDGLEDWLSAMIGATFDIQPLAETAPVNVKWWRGVTLAPEEILNRRNPDPMIDAGIEQW